MSTARTDVNMPASLASCAFCVKSSAASIANWPSMPPYWLGWSREYVLVSCCSLLAITPISSLLRQVRSAIGCHALGLLL